MKFTHYKKAELTLRPNIKLIPVNILPMDTDGVKEFNRIYKYLKSSKYNEIKFTENNYISKDTRFPAWAVRATTSVAELIVISNEGMFRIQCRNSKYNNTNSTINGYQAFRELKKILSKNGINIDTYAIDNGVEYKAQFKEKYLNPFYLIKLERNSLKDLTFENVHHIDFHSSFPAGLVNTHPEFKTTMEYLYEHRKENENYKVIMNKSIGYMHSEICCKAKWAVLALDAIQDNNIRLLELSNRIIESGRVILSYNTDGIWYMGDIYHGQGEGDALGEWSNDHMNTTWRAKSDGAYEFIEDGKYYAILRGHTLLDDEISRTDWQWGDIYRDDANILKYVLTDEGLVEDNDER